MGELKLKISDVAERKFREYALKKYGYRKGAISKAAEMAIIEAMKKPEKNAFLESSGKWKDIDAGPLIKKIYDARKAPREKVEF